MDLGVHNIRTMVAEFWRNNSEMSVGQFGTKWLQTEKLHVRRNQAPPNPPIRLPSCTALYCTALCCAIMLMMHASGRELAGTDDAGRELAGTGRELR